MSPLTMEIRWATGKFEVSIRNGRSVVITYSNMPVSMSQFHSPSDIQIHSKAEESH